MRRKHYMLVGGPIAVGLITVVAILVLTEAVGPANSTPTATPATAQQRQEFSDLIQRYWQVFFHGWTTGDLSQFPTVFFNDPSEHFNTHTQQELTRQGGTVATILAKRSLRPGEGRTGMLSAQMADVLDRRQSVQLWDAAQNKAASEGRQATLDDMPDGRIPVFAPENWVEKKVFLTQAFVNGDHATAVYVFDNPDSPLLYHVDLIQVEGSWYVTNYWVTGNP